MARDATMSMSVGGVKKISLWKKSSSGKWVECPNLPATFVDVYLKRGFVKSPPEETVEVKEESKPVAKTSNAALDKAKAVLDDKV
tara:strand:+ start:2914 stop:3168 length:255 start_codon:yes stop_codon:yes gene_type:complete